MNQFEKPVETEQSRSELLTTPEEQRLVIPDLVPAYQQAFAGEPWFEVSRCAGCERGFSGQRPGESCADCGYPLTEPAYPSAKLSAKLEQTVDRGNTVLYTERDRDGNVLLASLALGTTPEQIYSTYYADRPRETMGYWLTATLPERLVWLAEVFADRTKRPQGNLRNFRAMCEQFAANLGSDTIAYRSINPRIISKAVAEFGSQCTVFEQEVQVPDRRAFVMLINWEVRRESACDWRFARQ